MLDRLSQSPEAVYARAVRPSYEGHLRSESSRPPHLTQNQNMPVQKQRADVAARQVHDARQQTKFDEQSQYNRVSSQASQVAEKLVQQVQKTRQEQVRSPTEQKSSDYGQRQKLNRTYVNESLFTGKRFIDEIA